LAVFFEPNTKPDALKAEREFSAKSRVTLFRGTPAAWQPTSMDIQPELQRWAAN